MAAGVAGGLVASLVMSGFQASWAKIAKSLDDGERTANKHEGTKEEPATVKAAEAISENALDHRLTKSEKAVAGPAVHYAMGATSGAIYGAMAELAPVVTVGAGAPFGAAVWVVADDMVVPALGLAKPATEVPASTHTYALASHLVYGLTTDLVRRAIRRVW